MERGCASNRFKPFRCCSCLEQRENLRRSLRTALGAGRALSGVSAPHSVSCVGDRFSKRLTCGGGNPRDRNHSTRRVHTDRRGRTVLNGRDWTMGARGSLVARQLDVAPPRWTVAVNLSPAQFLSGSLTDTIAQVIDAVGIRADRLELEITEDGSSPRRRSTISTH